MRENLFVYLKHTDARIYKITTFATDSIQADNLMRNAFKKFVQSGRRGLTADEIDACVYGHHRAHACNMIKSILPTVADNSDDVNTIDGPRPSFVTITDVPMSQAERLQALSAVLARASEENKQISKEIMILKKSAIIGPDNLPRVTIPCTHLTGREIANDYHGRHGSVDAVDFNIFGMDKTIICEMSFPHSDLQ